jgi:tetratricopeptide (TPR) repeat protein
MDGVQPITVPVVEYDGFVLLLGERIPVREVDRVLEVTVPLFPDSEARNAFLWRCGKLCELRGLLDPAGRYVEAVQASLREGDEDHLAACILAKGCLQEKMGDYRRACEAYRAAFNLPIRNNETWYFLFNNLGYSLDMVGEYEEAEGYCRAAIILDPERHNAHKNLGLALEGLKRFVEAADCFIRGTICCPEDPRALAHLKAMLERHPEVGREAPQIVKWLCTHRLDTEDPRGNA